MEAPANCAALHTGIWMHVELAFDFIERDVAAFVNGVETATHPLAPGIDLVAAIVFGAVVPAPVTTRFRTAMSLVFARWVSRTVNPEE